MNNFIDRLMGRGPAREAKTGPIVIHLTYDESHELSLQDVLKSHGVKNGESAVIVTTGNDGKERRTTYSTSSFPDYNNP